MSYRQSEPLVPMSEGGERRPSGTEAEPVFFGGGGKRLYGCLHSTQSAPRQGAGVVFCQPIGAEYTRCHRPLRRLADMLAEAGFAVLRFDYYGCGDSLGETEDATLSQCLEDIQRAVGFLRARFRLTRVTLLGVRLGAALAVRVGAERESAEQIVLWDPIVRGGDFLDSVRDQSAEFKRHMVRQFGPRPASVREDGPGDLVGYPYGRQMLDEIAALDLLQTSESPAKRVLILDNCMDPAAEGLRDRLAVLGAAVELERLTAPKVWLSEPNQGLVPYKSLKFLSGWLGTAL